MKTPLPTILIDSREQAPWQIDTYPVEVVGLPVGDYGVRGFSDWVNPRFIVERKSLADLVQSLTWERERFWKEIEKMNQFRFRCLIVEADRADMENGCYGSRANPHAIIQSVLALQVRCNVHVVWAGTPEGAARLFQGLVRQFVRGIEKEHWRLLKKTV